MPQRVAVVVRTKDRPSFLARALADIAAQHYAEHEVVVVNDGGERRAVVEVVAASAMADRVTVLDTRGGGGRCAAANAGVRATDAPYVVLHDDDDRWHPDFLVRTAAALDADPDAAGVMTATEIVYEERVGDEWVESGRVPFWAGMTSVTLTSLLEINRAVPISVLYRRELHDRVGFYDESLETVEDWDFYLRVAAQGRFAFIAGEPLAFWTQRPQAVGADANSMFELTAQHGEDDRTVRDRALREWVARNGVGLPLYLASMEQRLRRDVDEIVARRLEEVLERVLDAQRRRIVDEVAAGHPVWSRWRRLCHRLRRAG